MTVAVSVGPFNRGKVFHPSNCNFVVKVPAKPLVVVPLATWTLTWDLGTVADVDLAVVVVVDFE